MAKLLDTGNLVLLENGSQRVLWQSFDHLSHTALPSMKLGVDWRSGFKRFLTSWKSQDDPGTGNCTYGINPSGFPQVTLYKGTTLVNRYGIGSWGVQFNKVATYVNNQDEVTVTDVQTELITRAVLDDSGILLRSTWNERAYEWTTFQSVPDEPCDEYGTCGPNGNCNPYSGMSKIDCTCLPGFEPKSPTDWNKTIWSGGCVKKNGTSMCRKGEGFVKMEMIKLPESSRAQVNLNVTLKECEHECLRNCSCTAYCNVVNGETSRCVTWYGDLMDAKMLPANAQDLYVRVDATVLAQYAKKSRDSLSKKGKLAISSLVPVLALFLLLSLVYWLLRRNRKGKQSESKYLRSTSYFGESNIRDVDQSRGNSDLPFFDLTTIAAATNNFSDENKLGTGGFGSVYKGVLPNGNEIAVKRLSKNSGQGTEEFKNEIVLIAKLQHRNLVRILGCCVEEEEKMIIYEYLPNKSLDFFIFNESNRTHLDWRRRFEIICGITRGILYLHQDSRLRIIHRDLKASNVLLDGSMNPKIADFGLARIFEGDQSEANTNRVVGTYGYMSPEYAMRGLFSVKSDVYSFGVIVLEIITGQKNTSHHPSSSLVEHVWNSWREGTALELVDSSLSGSCPVDEVLRCIQIAFLCLQEHATDRPNMSEVLVMLGNDAALPEPMRPAFLMERSNNSEDSSNRERTDSVNEVTHTTLEAR
ncbi:hypothetical protein ABKV19_023778 [Rosa sericea]